MKTNRVAVTALFVFLLSLFAPLVAWCGWEETINSTVEPMTVLLIIVGLLILSAGIIGLAKYFGRPSPAQKEKQEIEALPKWSGGLLTEWEFRQYIFPRLRLCRASSQPIGNSNLRRYTIVL